MVRALGLEPGKGKSLFTDVKESDWYSGYIKTAVEYKLLAGYGNGKYGPMDKITREQAMTIISRAMILTGLKVDLHSSELKNIFKAFGMKVTPSKWAENNIALCIKSGIVSKIDGKMNLVNGNITRAEVAVIVRRLLQKSNLI